MVPKQQVNIPVTLDTLQQGQKGNILRILSGNSRLQRKLLTMGYISGTDIEVVCRAPLGDPIQVRALGYNLSLRLSEAKFVEVSPA